MSRVSADVSRVSADVSRVSADVPRVSVESSDHDPSPPASNLLPSQIRQQEQQKHQHSQEVTYQQHQSWQQEASKQVHSPDKSVYQSHGQSQFVHQPVKQAHVR